MRRNSPDPGDQIPCPEKEEHGDHSESLGKRLLTQQAYDKPYRDVRQLFHFDKQGKFRAGKPFSFQLLPTVPGLPETTCRVNYDTGEILCNHELRAPRNRDCRLAICLHREEMRSRITQRLSRALLRSKPDAEQYLEPGKAGSTVLRYTEPGKNAEDK